MNVTSNTAWLLDPRYAPTLRYMQDLPLTTAMDLQYSAPYAKRVADFVRQVKIMTDQQLDAISRVIESKRWVEPPRFRPWADVVPEKYHWDCNQWKYGDVYTITACPGVPFDDVKALIAGKPEGMHGEITIGDICEYTRSVEDPRLAWPYGGRMKRGQKSNYVTVCRRLVARATELGNLIEDEARSA